MRDIAEKIAALLTVMLIAVIMLAAVVILIALTPQIRDVVWFAYFIWTLF